nr:ABC transporter ATP-binding protein [Caulobacteraceae bacterium]
ALGALTEVEMAPLAGRGVRDMSGGERARVLFARLLATGAPLLLADEPAAGLDPEAQFLVMHLLRRRLDSGVAVLATFHDLTLAARACDRIGVMSGGRLLTLAPPSEALTASVLAEAFGLEGGLIATPAGPVVAVRRP